MTVATNRKRTPRSRKDTGLTGAEEMFVYGKTNKPINQFETLSLTYPRTEKEQTTVEELNRLKAGLKV